MSAYTLVKEPPLGTTDAGLNESLLLKYLLVLDDMLLSSSPPAPPAAPPPCPPLVPDPEDPFSVTSKLNLSSFNRAAGIE